LYFKMSSFENILKSYENAKKRKVSSDEPISQSIEVVCSRSVDDPSKLPQFLIVGAQKGGTMAAVKNLNKHPEIYVLSEPHYFDLAWHKRDANWYVSQFDSNKPIRGEKTPELIYVDECAERIKEVCPNAKFVLFLRDPVARAYSSWNMNVSKNREGAPFDECVQRNLDNLDEFRSYGTGEFHYVQRGLYLDQIERFLKVFPNKEKFLVVVSERMKTNPQEEYNRIFKFLGAKPFEFLADEDHIGSYLEPIGTKVEEKLRKFYAPHNERLFKFLGYRVPEWEISSSSKQAKSSSSSSSSDKMDTASAAAVAVAVAVAGPPPTSVKHQSTASTGLFAQLGRKHGTDKVTHHGYHRFYPRFIEHYRGVAGAAMLEIGIDQSKSLNTWLEYFPQAFIYGIDISISKQGERYSIFKADQSEIRDIQFVAEHSIKHPLFLIVDDGSHIPEHQVQCFDYLFGSKALMPGGTYIVEDIETSYWSRGGLYGYKTQYGYHHERSAVEIFKDLLDDVNEEFLTDSDRRKQQARVGQEISAATRRHISSVSFGQNCIIIVKKTEEEFSYSDRVYRYKKNL
jgi:hypothetical protein